MKKILAVAVSALVCLQGFSQRDNDSKKDDDYGDLKGGFKQENIFIGGSLNAGFGTGQFSIGGNPEIGYSIAQWLDVGVGFNVTYNTLKAEYNYFNPGYNQRAFNFGTGPFFRLYPVNFLFVQGQFEQNWTKNTYINDAIDAKAKIKTSASSLITGIGYTQRVIGEGSYFLMVGLDLLKNKNSPYIDYNEGGHIVAQPIFRAGFNFYLRPSKQAAREPRYRGDHTL